MQVSREMEPDDDQEPMAILPLRWKSIDGSEQTFSFGLALTILYGAYKAMHAIKDQQDLLSLVTLIGFLIKKEEPSYAENERILAGLLEIQRGGPAKEKWTAPEDPILSFCYYMLRAKRITRQQAADLASDILGRPIDREAWRKRVDRWAAAPERRLPQIGKPRERGKT